MAKHERELEEFDSLSEISHASPNAKVHSVVTLLSPVKKSKTCSYFDGDFTNGKACMHMFSFDAGVCKKLL